MEKSGLISTAKAAKIAGVTSATIINWCNDSKYRVGEFGIGYQRGRIWRIDRRKLQFVMEGRSTELKAILENENDIYERVDDKSLKAKLIKGIETDLKKLKSIIRNEDEKRK